MSQRLAFANQLRGVAALCVVVIHYTVAYQLFRPDIAWVVAAPPLEGPVPGVATWLFPRWFDGGAFGVALFFMISGFVIPFSLASTSRLGFLAARALRIYPTFWIALIVEWLAVAASAAYWHRPIVYGWPAFWRNALLVNTLGDSVSVDFVSWTLSVEVKFYLLMAALRPLVLAGRTWPLLLVAAGALALTVSEKGRLPPLLVQEAMYLVYMLTGTLIHYHYRGWLAGWRMAAGCAALLGIAALCWAWGPAGDLWPYKPANYAYAVGVFMVSYALRDRLPGSALLDALAAISYPLYLVHALLGFTIMSFLIARFGTPYPAAAVVALAASVLAATLLHRTVERASVSAGRRIARAWEPVRRISSHAMRRAL